MSGARRKFVSLLGATALLGALCAIGCTPPGKPDIKDKYVHPDDVRDFDKLFAKNCVGCHGADGKTGPAPPLNDGLFRSLYTKEQLTDILDKGRGTQMPAFAPEMLGDAKKSVKRDEQIAVLVKGLLGEKVEGEPTDWAAATPIDAAYRYDAVRGKGMSDKDDKDKVPPVFTETCAKCHGPDGRRDEHSIRKPAMLALMTDEVLYRLIITGRPDLGMPPYDQHGEAKNRKLKPEEVANLLALLKKWKTDAKKEFPSQ